MKFILTADTHYRSKAPRSRLDNFALSQYNKTDWILQQCLKYDAALLIAGDIFDSATPSFELVNSYIDLFKKYNIFTTIVFGNHDLRQHRMSTWKNTGLGVLVLSGVVKMLGSSPLEFNNVNLYGMNWREEIPRIVNKNKYNICLLHDMIIDEKQLYEGQEKATQGKILIEKHNYNLMLSGHNHQSFSCGTNKILVNPGSISRMNITQIDFQPRVGLIDTSTQEFQWINIPIEKSSEVFDLNKIEVDQEKSIEMQEFVEALKLGNQDKKFPKVDFVNTLEINIKENNYSDDIVDLIHKSMDLNKNNFIT